MSFSPSFRFRSRFIAVIFSLVPSSVLIVGAPSATAQSRTTGAPFTATIQNYLNGPMDKNAFDQGLALAKDRAEAPAARRMVLDKMQSARRGMDSGRLRALRDEAVELAKNPNEDPAVAGQAIGTLASVNRLMLERGEITTASAKSEMPWLMETAKNAARPGELRGRAIRALADLGAREAAPMIKGLLADRANLDRPEVVRQACLALARLSPGEALGPIADVMGRTTDPVIFGTGAFALGELKTPEAMASLVKLQGRFPDSASCEAALSRMGGAIAKTLRRPDDPNLGPAIQAMRTLPPSARRALAPSLRELLRTAPQKARKEALGELLAQAEAMSFDEENRELRQLLGLVEGQPDFVNEIARIRQRLAAKPLAITEPAIPVPTE